MAQYNNERSKRYDIPVANLDYGYISKCSNIKELEKIIKLLRSGEEGSFPELTSFAEKHLEKLDPKNRVLRKSAPVKTSRDLPKDELHDLQGELENWSNQIKNSKLGDGDESGAEIPPVRGQNAKIQNNQNSSENSEKKSTRRVKPRDYREWDKVDVEAELEKIDNPDQPSKTPPVAKAEKVSSKVDTTGLTGDEKQIKADREKDKGNEAFRAGDYEEAALYYSRSISIIYTVASTNNRAQCYIKLKQWNKALKDCSAVLKHDSANLKALLRRGVAYQGKGELTNAKNDLKQVLHKEPNNKRANDLLGEVENALKEQKNKGRRMLIEETDGSSSESEYEDAQDTTDQSPKMTNGHTEKRTPTAEKVNNVAAKEKTIAENKTVESADTSNKSADQTSPPVTQKPPVSSADKTKEKPADRKSEEAPTKAVPQLPLPAVVTNWKEEANTAFKNGQYGVALNIYTKAINKLLKDSTGHAANLSVLYSNRAAANLKNGDCSACVKDCSASLELSPGSLKPLLRRAQAQEALERYRLAYNDYRHALHIGGANDVVHQGLSRCQNILQQQDGRRWREKLPAMPTLGASQAISCAPAAVNSSSSVQKSTPPSNGSSSTGPSSTDSPAKGVSLEQEYETMKDRGNNHVKQGKFSEAVECYACCIRHFPDRIVPYTNRALCYLRLNKPDLVINDCNEAIRIESDNIKALFRRGQAYKMKQSYEKSIADLEKVIKLDPKNSAAVRELKVVQNYKLEEDKKSADNKKRQRLKIEEVEDSSSDSSSDSSDNEEEASPKAGSTVEEELSDMHEQLRSGTVEEELSDMHEQLRSAQSDHQSAQKRVSDKEAELKRVREELEKKETVLKQSNQILKEQSEKGSSPQKSSPSKSNKQSAQNGSSQKSTAEPATSQKESSPEKATKANKNSPVKTTRPNQPNEPANKGKSAPTKSSASNPVRTPFEFLHAWSSLKPAQGVESYVKLLDDIEPQDLPKVVSNKLDGTMLSMLFKCMHHLIASGKANLALSYLQHLTAVPRFQMVTMFMSDKEKHDLAHVLKDLEAQANCDILLKDLDKLRKQYSLC